MTAPRTRHDVKLVRRIAAKHNGRRLFFSRPQDTAKARWRGSMFGRVNLPRSAIISVGVTCLLETSSPIAVAYWRLAREITAVSISMSRSGVRNGMLH